jgi:type IV pilus assembly protein PilB
MVQSRWQSAHERFCEALVQQGIIPQPLLQEMLAQQRSSGLKLGEFLIHKGVLRENQLVDLLSRHLRFEKYEAEHFPLEQNIKNYLPPQFAKKYHLVPLSVENRTIRVAMTDPLDVTALDAIEELTNLEAAPVVCTEVDLCDLMFTVYGISSELDEGLTAKAQLDFETEEPDEAAQDITVFSLQGLAEEAPVIRLVNSILTRAIRENASDVHISPEKKYVQVRFRVDGKLRQVPAPPKTYFLPVVSRIKILAGMDIAITRIPQDGRFTFRIDDREIHVRVSCLPTLHGENLVMRLLEITGRNQTLGELGLSVHDRGKVDRALTKPWGMILSTGPTGSGKSTSLYAMLRVLNQPDVNIITLEDPAEYRIEKVRQVQLNRKAGMTFASGLRSILRQDPDVVMVGEIRDGETANIAVQAALTGHKMLSTLHTNDSAGAITRLMEMGVEPFLISSTLLVVIAQRLVRKVCQHCREPYKPSKEALAAMGLAKITKAAFQRGQGCQHCHGTGFSGRTGIFEILEIDTDIQDRVLRRETAQQITQAAVTRGVLRTLKQDAATKAARGITTLEEAGSAVLI